VVDERVDDHFQFFWYEANKMLEGEVEVAMPSVLFGILGEGECL
jgi:hypothetical protein